MSNEKINYICSDGLCTYKGKICCKVCEALTACEENCSYSESENLDADCEFQIKKEEV